MPADSGLRVPPGSTPDQRLAIVRDAYLQSAAENRYSEPADGVLRELITQHPEYARGWAYLGANRMLEAAAERNLFRKGDLTRQGADAIEHAVGLDGDDIEIAALYAITLYELPTWFNRRQQAMTTLAEIVDQLPEAAAAQQIDPRIAAAATARYAQLMAEQQSPDAQRNWQQAYDLAPDSQAGKSAAQHLPRAEDPSDGEAGEQVEMDQSGP